jgi:class 3 adenylate cyclase
LLGAARPHHSFSIAGGLRLTQRRAEDRTALFTDLKGSTALMEALDPEEARANRLRTQE